eukprot:5907768-Prymnesium_polylepis.2
MTLSTEAIDLSKRQDELIADAMAAPNLGASAGDNEISKQQEQRQSSVMLSLCPTRLYTSVTTSSLCLTWSSGAGVPAALVLPLV